MIFCRGVDKIVMKRTVHILHVAASLSANSAAGRLCLALRSAGCRVTPLAAFPPLLEGGQFFSNNIWQSSLRSRFGQIPLRLFPQRQKDMPWSTPFVGNNIDKWVEALQPDVVHMHWSAASTVNLKCLSRITAPIVWTFHDVWPITAGCHCNMECTQWRFGCENCPQLGCSVTGLNLAKYLWGYKRRAFANAKIDAICPSRWLTEMTLQSPLWEGKNIHHLGNALDTNVFSPANKIEMRRVWKLPVDKPIILFGATVTSIFYKGFDLLLQALEHLRSQGVEAHLAVFGENPANNNLQFPATCVGYVHDAAKLASLYACADVFVVPSRQDNLPTTALEACSCGVPCVAFSVGGIPEIVLHNKSGYIAQNFDVKDLAHGIRHIIENPAIGAEWGKNARMHMLNNYESTIIARQLIDIYENILLNF